MVRAWIEEQGAKFRIVCGDEDSASSFSCLSTASAIEIIRDCLDEFSRQGDTSGVDYEPLDGSDEDVTLG